MMWHFASGIYLSNDPTKKYNTGSIVVNQNLTIMNRSTSISRFSALLLVPVLFGMSLVLQNCTDQCTDTVTYTYYEPIFTPLSVIRSGVAVVAPQPLTEVGKIYFKDDFLFVNDPGRGIHVIDNSNPASPVKKSFITIPGNYDLSIRNTILYADSYIDLVALDISDVNNVVEVSRLENIFGSYNSMGFYADAQRGVVTDWVEIKNVTINKSECESRIEQWGGIFLQDGIGMPRNMAFSAQASISPVNSTGVGGSMARFTINENHLYMLDGGNIHTADISIPAAPEKTSSQYLAWDIETIFPYGDKLFIGARSGMHIFDLSTPENPVKITTYMHINSCDPVVVSGDYAYVTLRSGTQCEGFTNQLEVLDISTITSPKLLKVYPMKNPHGLGIDDSLLFICDGDAGLKIYNASDKMNIDKKMVKHYKDINAYDVIPYNGVLMLIGKDGVFQYDYSNPSSIKKLSHIKIQREN
jgi:hypothetical protein